MAENIVEKLITCYQQKKLAHAYLIETDDKVSCLSELKKLFKIMCCLDSSDTCCNNCVNCKSIDNNEFLNVLVVEPDGNQIKRQQIQDLKNKLSYKPVLAPYFIYVIMGAEKLNAVSTNIMLKFIEEPPEDCFGFFLVNNKENVLSTIQSRCENIKLFYNKQNIFELLDINDEDKDLYIDVVKRYIYSLEVEKNKSIMYNKDVILANFTEKNDVEKLFKLILEYYNVSFYNKLNYNYESMLESLESLSGLSMENLKNKIELISEYINKFKYNLNLELMLDRFVIEIGEIDE